jgi:hypothetical protein
MHIRKVIKSNGQMPARTRESEVTAKIGNGKIFIQENPQRSSQYRDDYDANNFFVHISYFSL